MTLAAEGTDLDHVVNGEMELRDVPQPPREADGWATSLGQCTASNPDPGT